MVLRSETHEDDLDGRSREVLREIVMKYIASGEPISSRFLARSGGFGLSPASLRNVMADLEDLGYVYQPHTSSGRVPTDRGYRFFINHYLKSDSLSHRERTSIDDQVSQVNDLDEVMHLASRLLSELSDQIGVVFMPTIHHLVMRSMNFISVADGKILCVIVGTNGVVVNKIVETGRNFSVDELEKLGRFISGEYGGTELDLVRRSLVSLLEVERASELSQKSISLGIEVVEDIMPYEHELYVEGATSILNKPEFADARTVRKTFLALQEKETLVEILNRCLTEEGLQIFVGSESAFTHSHNFSLVASRYGSIGSPMGLVAILGPTRMEYARMAPLVDYLGRALSRKIEQRETAS